VTAAAIVKGVSDAVPAVREAVAVRVAGAVAAVVPPAAPAGLAAAMAFAVAASNEDRRDAMCPRRDPDGWSRARLVETLTVSVQAANHVRLPRVPPRQADGPAVAVVRAAAPVAAAPVAVVRVAAAAREGSRVEPAAAPAAPDRVASGAGRPRAVEPQDLAGPRVAEADRVDSGGLPLAVDPAARADPAALDRVAAREVRAHQAEDSVAPEPAAPVPILPCGREAAAPVGLVAVVPVGAAVVVVPAVAALALVPRIAEGLVDLPDRSATPRDGPSADRGGQGLR
jgi:hypothetical protein